MSAVVANSLERLGQRHRADVPNLVAIKDHLCERSVSPECLGQCNGEYFFPPLASAVSQLRVSPRCSAVSTVLVSSDLAPPAGNGCRLYQACRGVSLALPSGALATATAPEFSMYPAFSHGALVSSRSSVVHLLGIATMSKLGVPLEPPGSVHSEHIGGCTVRRRHPGCADQELHHCR